MIMDNHEEVYELNDDEEDNGQHQEDMSSVEQSEMIADLLLEDELDICIHEVQRLRNRIRI